MPREITHHGAILEAVRHSGVISELVEKHENHFKYELDLELVVYGRNYAGKKVGPYARLLIYSAGEEIIHEGEWKGNAFYILVDGRLDVYISNGGERSSKIGEIEPQNSFGEMSLLAGQPTNATVVVSAGTEATVLEIQRPALRLLRKLKKFGQRLEEDYRRHGLERTLLEVQEATNNSFSSELLEKFKEATRFRVYAKGHVLFEEGNPIERLFFINSGWTRRARGLASNLTLMRSLDSDPLLADMVMKLDEDVGLDFLGAGNWLGLDAIFENDQASWKYSATIMARTEVLEIEISHLRSNPALVKMISEHFPQFSRVDDKPPEPPSDRRSVAAAGKEIATGIVDGTNLLVMDMDLCIRCGNCSLACHKVHGQSRLLRRGIHITRPVTANSHSTQHVLSPSVCLHCQDPECLTGCPTGAIGRFAEGQIDIDPKTCIGCGDCATQCPYNAISMIPRKSPVPQTSRLNRVLKNWFSLGLPTAPQAVTETDDLLAVKCNLCENTSLNPEGGKTSAYSCQENCPTGALVRVNPKEYFSEAKNAIGIVFRDQTHAIGRNIHKQDIPARLFHLGGVLAIIAVTWATIWAARRYTLDGHLAGTWLTVRWITGLLGLGGIAVVMAYPGRKQIYKRRAGPLRYWMLAHVYLGLIAGVVLLLHGGHASGGLLTSSLMVSFDLVIASGVFGIGCYLIVPRIMTSIEGDPLLIEDLRARRQELRKTLSLIDTSDDQLRHLIKEKMRRRFFSFRYLLRQYLRREELTRMLAEAREEFHNDAEALSDPKARRALMEAVETTATLRRVDSLIYLHQLLKLWLAPHVVTSSIMLALMLIHIIQVVLFTVR
ncbi:MAG: cyclic nucleotide-binding domain-containing protein [Acidobacteriota bacterium]|nr:cyclic nucleotide-binding domain-containing protein [Acidobacteriota bacterium]